MLRAEHTEAVSLSATILMHIRTLAANGRSTLLALQQASRRDR